MAKMTRATLRTFYLRALADEDPVTAQYYFQKMQEYDEALRLYGIGAAKATLPKVRVRRAGGRMALMKRYLAALKDGDDELAQALMRRIAARDKSGLMDDRQDTDRSGLPLMDMRGAHLGDVPEGFFKAKDLPKRIMDEYRAVLAGLRR